MNWTAINWSKPPKGDVLLFWPAMDETRPPMIRVGNALGSPARKPTHYMPLPPPPRHPANF